MNIHEKLIAIQQNLTAPKNQYNAFGKYKYRSLEDILEAVKPLLDKHELTIAFEDELVQIGDRYYIKATAILSTDGRLIKNVAFAREPLAQKGMNESQITGSASSYARKYAINGLFAIDDNKDPDSTNKNGPPKPKQKQAEIVDVAWLEFEAKHQAILTEEAFLHFEFDRAMFEAAIIKHSPTHALPTKKASVPKILKMIKPEECLKEKKNGNNS